jgi:predicted peptidase
MIGVLSAMALAASPLAEGQQPHAPISPGGYSFQLHVPPGALKKGTPRQPLMIFLHGSGERGSNLDQVKVHGPPKVAARDPSFPFLLVSPQLSAEQDWDVAKLNTLLAWALKTLPADPDRVILTGLSRGGHATWRWSAAEPWRFAAVAPVAGRGDPATACALKDMPVWAFHGDRDDVVTPEGSFAMARAIRSCGGSPRLTIYPDLGHNSWDPAYDDPALYLWMLQKRRQPTNNKDKK